MPHWGMSLALGTNINDVALPDRLKQGYEHLPRRSSAGPTEVTWSRGWWTRWPGATSRTRQAISRVREQAYSAAMGDLSKRFPDDLDVATLYAESMMNLHPWKLYKAGWQPGAVDGRDRRRARARAGAKSAAPWRQSLLHSRGRGVEDAGPRRRRRWPARNARARRGTPGPHAGAHLHSHRPVRQVGESQCHRGRRGREVLQGDGARGFYAMAYYGHNLQFESAAAMFAGNFAQARDAARRTVALAEPIADQMAMLEPFAAQELLVLARFGRWSEVLAATAKAPAPTRTIAQRALSLRPRRRARRHREELRDAEAELDALKASAAKIPKDAMLGPNNSGAAMAAVATADLTARIAEARGDLEAAAAGFRAAVEAEDRLLYNEPPDWLLPERERLGVVLLKAKKRGRGRSGLPRRLDATRGQPALLVWIVPQPRGTEESLGRHQTAVRGRVDGG